MRPKCLQITMPLTFSMFGRARNHGKSPRNIVRGGHKPGKLREFEKLSKTQGNLNFHRKTWKTHGKLRILGIIADENVFQRINLSRIAQGKFENDLEISGKTQRI